MRGWETVRDFARRHTVAIAVAVDGAGPAARADPAGPRRRGRLPAGRAGAWDPQPDSLFGPYWVDRPPPLIAVFGAVDALGGVTTLRSSAPWSPG